ncbi:MAG: hypothetical protein ACYDG4_13930 [Desulfuromonadaceae bacterium]
MTLSKKIQNMAVFIEFLTGSGLAIFFHVVLHSPEVAYSIFAIGILLSLATYLLREDMEGTRNELVKQYHHAHEIMFAVSRIADPECQAKAHELLDAAKRTIVLLQQGCLPLVETEFHLEEAKCTDMVLQRLKAVDPMNTGWYSSGALVNFYQSNLRALERGVAITRIFVMNREELAAPDIQKILLAQHRDGVDIRVAFRNELPAVNGIGGRDITSSYDFTIFDDQTVTEVYQKSGTYYGFKTSCRTNAEKHLRLYELIEYSAHAVLEEGELITLASEVHNPAP